LYAFKLCFIFHSFTSVVAFLLTNNFDGFVWIFVSELKSCRPYFAVPDAIVLQLVKERLSQIDCVTRGWVLHEYPRSRDQAESLEGAGYTPNR